MQKIGRGHSCRLDRGEVVRAPAASPIRYLTAERATPDAFLAWGLDDAVVSTNLTLAFAAELEHPEFCIEKHPVAGAGYHWFSRHPIGVAGGVTARIAPAVGEFVARRMPA